LRGLDVGIALGEPAAGGRRDFELFMADGLSIELDGEFTFVLSENGAGRHGGVLFLSRQACGGARKNQRDTEGKRKFGPGPGICVRHKTSFAADCEAQHENLRRRNLRALF
jgi:hypothetical protein